MSVASADPDALRTAASAQQTAADTLLLDSVALDAAEAAFRRRCPEHGNDIFSPAPASDDLRRVAQRLVMLADDVDRVGRAFFAADHGGNTHGSISVTDEAIVRALALEDPTVSILGRLRRMSPSRRRAVMAALDRSTIAELIERHPVWTGNTDGVPWRMRVRANHRLVVHALRDRSPGGPLATVLRRLGDEQVIVFDPDDGRVAVVHGDLDTATDVAVFVPGMMSAFVQFFHGGASTDDKARALYDTARTESPDRRPAVIAWLGYRAPQSLPEAASTTDAAVGGVRLRRFVEGLGVPADRRTVLVGHSYGTLTIGRALLDGLHVDAFVAAGSPGLGANRAESFDDALTETVSVLAAPGDPVAQLGAFGTPPADPAFHARRLTVNSQGRPRVERHAHYFRRGSASLRNMAAVVVGGAVRVQNPSPADRAASWVDQASEPLRPGLDEAARLAERYHGPGGEAIQTGSAMARTIGHTPRTATRLVVDGIEEMSERFP